MAFDEHFISDTIDEPTHYLCGIDFDTIYALLRKNVKLLLTNSPEKIIFHKYVISKNISLFNLISYILNAEKTFEDVHIKNIVKYNYKLHIKYNGSTIKVVPDYSSFNYQNPKRYKVLYNDMKIFNELETTLILTAVERLHKRKRDEKKIIKNSKLESARREFDNSN